MDEFKLAIWWPLRLLPDEIDFMLKSELIQTLLEKKSLRCRMYENEKGVNILRMTHVEPHKPHLYITNIEKDTVLPGYTATCEIPDVYGWKEIFQSFTQPVVYPVLIKTTDKSLGMLGQNNFVICHFKLVEYDKVDKLGSSYGGINYPYPERWTYPENTSLIYIDGPEKSLAQHLQEEYDERRKKLIDKIKNGDTEFNNISGDGGPTMDYRIQSYNDYGAHGPIKPLVLVEGESKPDRHNKKHRDFPLKAKRYLVGFDEHGNDIWQDIKHDKTSENETNEQNKEGGK